MDTGKYKTLFAIWLSYLMTIRGIYNELEEEKNGFLPHVYLPSTHLQHPHDKHMALQTRREQKN